jgi:hypothetical protein
MSTLLVAIAVVGGVAVGLFVLLWLILYVLLWVLPESDDEPTRSWEGGA